MEITLGELLEKVDGYRSSFNNSYAQVIKTFSTREDWWYIGIKGDGGVKSKGTRLLIEKEK